MAPDHTWYFLGRKMLWQSAGVENLGGLRTRALLRGRVSTRVAIPVLEYSLGVVFRKLPYAGVHPVICSHTLLISTSTGYSHPAAPDGQNRKNLFGTASDPGQQVRL